MRRAIYNSYIQQCASSRVSRLSNLEEESLWITGTSLAISVRTWRRLIIGELIRASPEPNPSSHALSATVPRRVARPASGIGSRGQARPAKEGGARVERVVAFQQGADAVILCQ